MGISLRHSGHFFVVGSGVAGALRNLCTSVLIGSTTKKYTAAATNRNEISAFRNSPYRNLLPFTSNVRAEKSCFPTIAAISGVKRSLTNDVTTAPNAAPITTATARSTTLPRNRNCLKPFMIASMLRSSLLLFSAHLAERFSEVLDHAVQFAAIPRGEGEHC